MSGQVEALAAFLHDANACGCETEEQCAETDRALLRADRILASDWLRDHDRALRESIEALADEMDAGGDWDHADVGARLRVLARGEQP